MMEKLVLMEFDKILHLIHFKQSQSTLKPVSMQDVNNKRNQINDTIKLTL